ncbi:syndecan-2 [Nothobranchius furzeri]|uniref:Syndecan n=1 Tax=Nothobranchius furzeri TaxID=105023 RepID=A0A1A8ATV9_NOTFU|nr:syndecan-2 [Nothobranchius furzeri]KAF7211467.1 transcript variant X2 [Nothobranchius furzeri]KAF7211468.1 transcript variant X1 [Nothobranchius furzeri]
MRSGWILLSVALSGFFCGGSIAEAARTSSQVDDLYLDDVGSGGFYPEDDDDFSSGSGSGAGEEVVGEVVTVSKIDIELKAARPTQDSTKDFTQRMVTATVGGRSRDVTPRKPLRTEDPVPATQDLQKNQLTSTTDTPGSPQEPIEVRTENLFQRTEVLAAVIAGGVIGFLFAIFLILLLVYRMRKKDEGSYDLGERKPSGAAYQKAPTKEFYA